MADAVTVSVVSHGQAGLAARVLQDLARRCSMPLDIILTLNVPEEIEPPPVRPGFAVRVLRNERPKGFGSNHNTAFRQARDEHFCVLNPDIRLDADPFPALLSALHSPQTGVVAPQILDGNGAIEPNARYAPTPLRILSKVTGLARRPDYVAKSESMPVDWAAGMFLLFRREAFARVGGFDERYFLYYEDADICRRLWRAGYRVMLEPRATAVHLARRTSHRNLRYLRWHIASMARYFLTR